ncbi:hypothetical protein IWW38_006267, partial [Coemansia aciculifera]
MLSGSNLTVSIAALVQLASAQYGFGGNMGYSNFGYAGVGYPGMGYSGMGYSGMGYSGMRYPSMGYSGAAMGGNAGGFIPTGFGHGIIQGASTSGAIIQGPSGTIVAQPQSAGSI